MDTRYLKQHEKENSRILWQTVFLEDSSSFLDYYYQEKIKNNQIVVIEDGDRIISMAHINPYQISVCDHLWHVGYLVAVATAPDQRHKGHMRAILTKIMKDCYQDNMPFLFLMPADEAIYLPFQFTYICNQPKWMMKTQAAQNITKRLCRSQEDWVQASRFMEAWLNRRYDCHTIRDVDYVKGLCLELKSEQGELELLFEESSLVGILGYWGIRQVEERVLMTADHVAQLQGEQPAMMGRIINLPAFLLAIRLKEEAKITQLQVLLTVEDPMIEQNNHTFLWCLDHNGSHLLEPGQAELALTIGISELTAWLMGYRTLNRPERHWDYIRTFQGVYLDEIV